MNEFKRQRDRLANMHLLTVQLGNTWLLCVSTPRCFAPALTRFSPLYMANTMLALRPRTPHESGRPV
eukprot:SAG11_NODE_1284_length_5305_cov_1.528621_2_plen_67_part_00